MRDCPPRFEPLSIAMSGQLLPPIELAPENLGESSPERCFAVWLDVLNSGYKLVLSGLTREIGPAGDVHAAYRQWYVEQMAEHDRTIERMLWRMQQR